jgi:type III secretory pathway component EscV
VFASLVWFPLPTKTLITIIIYTNIAMAILLFMLCIDEFAAGRRALFVLKQ